MPRIASEIGVGLSERTLAIVAMAWACAVGMCSLTHSGFSASWAATKSGLPVVAVGQPVATLAITASM